MVTGSRAISDLNAENLSCLKPGFALPCLLRSEEEACSQPTAARLLYPRLLLKPKARNVSILAEKQARKTHAEQERKPYVKAALLFKGQADVTVFWRVRTAPPGMGNSNKGRTPHVSQHPAFWQSH